jgi:RNA polymerase sigma-32 factor
MAAELVEGADALGEKLNRDGIAALARQFEVPGREVIAIARRLAWPDTSLDRPAARADGVEAATLGDRVADDGPSPEDSVIGARETTARRGALGEALALLTPRERLIITRRHLAEAAASFASIGRELGLSKERVRVLERKAMDKLRAKLGVLIGQPSRA